MEKNSLIRAMKTSISEVLEKMFFLPLEFSDIRISDKTWNIKDEKIYGTKLTFKGAFSGHFIFLVPDCVARSVTADFMGKNEGDVSVENMTGTIKEMINMIGGNSFTSYDGNSTYDLGIPSILSQDEIARELTMMDDISILIDTLGNQKLGIKMNIRH